MILKHVWFDFKLTKIERTRWDLRRTKQRGWRCLVWSTERPKTYVRSCLKRIDFVRKNTPSHSSCLPACWARGDVFSAQTRKNKANWWQDTSSIDLHKLVYYLNDGISTWNESSRPCGRWRSWHRVRCQKSSTYSWLEFWNSNETEWQTRYWTRRDIVASRRRTRECRWRWPRSCWGS